jgi:hypothetical protein
MAGINDGATCMVAAEGSFGSILSTDARALDDTTIAGLTARSVKVTIDSFANAAGALRQVAYDRSDVTLSGGMSQARVEAAVNGSGPVKRLVGTVSMEGELRGFGALSPSNTAFGLLMASGCAATIRTPGTSATGTYISANTFSTPSPGNDATIAAGDIIAVTQTDGTYRFVKVTSKVDAGATNTITTLEPHGIANAGTATVRQCHMYYPARGGSVGSSVCAQFALADAAQTLIGVGGRLKSMEIMRTGAASLAWRAEVEFPDGEYRAAVVIPVLEPYPMGAASGATTPLVTLVAPMLVTEDHAGDAAPWSGTAASLPARTWSAKLVNDLQPVADQATRSGRSETAVTATNLEGSFVQTAPVSGADWREVLRLGEKRTCSFTAAGANAAGNGCCVWVGAVEVAADPGVTLAPTDQTQDVSFRAGDYTGDDGTGGACDLEFVLAFTA